jgi:hypothetical protein
MNPGDLEVRIDNASVAELRDWASLWGDLLHVDMVLLAREKFEADASNIFIRRALWESAVISYGRTAISGRRHSQIQELLKLLGPEADAFHKEVMSWRNQHVAHRVDGSRESTEARGIIDLATQRIRAIRVHVSPVLGPEEEDDDLAKRFKRYVEELRNLAWTQRIVPSEQRAIQANSEVLDDLLAKASSLSEPNDRGFSIDIDPTGGSAG